MSKFIFPIIVGVFVIALFVVALCPAITLSNEQYDRLKWLSCKWTLFVLFLGGVTKAIDFKYALATVTIFAGLGSLLEGLLAKSTAEYKNHEYIYDQDGDIDFDEIEESEEVEDNGITITDDEE